MRHPAAGAPRPARTQPHRPIRAAHLPRPRPPPARQHGAAARRAPQLTRRQPALDSIKIGLYGDHCASKREQTALPQTPAKETTGGPSPTNDLITVPPRHHKQQPAPTDQDQLLSPSAGTLPPRGHPECLRTPTPPSHCPDGHRLGPGEVLVGHQACLGHGGGHTSWTCRVCDQTVYGPPLNTHFQPRADKRTLGFGGFS